MQKALLLERTAAKQVNFIPVNTQRARLLCTQEAARLWETSVCEHMILVSQLSKISFH